MLVQGRCNHWISDALVDRLNNREFIRLNLCLDIVLLFTSLLVKEL
jgi:hypothetical protein